MISNKKKTEPIENKFDIISTISDKNFIRNYERIY